MNCTVLTLHLVLYNLSCTMPSNADGSRIKVRIGEKSNLYPLEPFSLQFLGAKAPLPLQHVKVKVTAKKFINRNIIIESPYDILYVIGNMICQYYKSYINDM